MAKFSQRTKQISWDNVQPHPNAKGPVMSESQLLQKSTRGFPQEQ